MSHEIPLPALREDNPRDFLAALGLLRLVDLKRPDARCRLCLSGPAGTPILSTISDLPDGWAESLFNDLKSLNEHPSQPLRHGSIIRTTSQNFRNAVSNAIDFSNKELPLAGLPPLLYAAYSSQLTDEKSDDVVPTAFSFGNGQGGKNLLLDVSQLIALIEPTECLKILQGRAKPVAAKTLRWNPVEFRPAAYRGPDPGTKTKGDETLDFPLFNVLAFIGLTFFPCVPRASGSSTAGFVRQSRQWYFQWPVWQDALTVAEIFTLVNLPSDETAGRSGIPKKWQSRRFSSDKSLYFGPGEPA
jgi:hypothetical protein